MHSSNENRNDPTNQILKVEDTPITLRPLPQLGLGAALIGQEEEELVLDVLRRKGLSRYYPTTRGVAPPMAATLESEFCATIGTRYALGVTSGSAALEVALGALGVGPGDEVILTAWSWLACFTSIVRVGALPVLADIDENFALAPGEITRLANERTKAALVVHYQGAAADMDLLLEEARQTGIKILEDCAQSAGAYYKGRRVGSMGDIATFSFQFLKTITSGEGGIVLTNDPQLYERCVRMHDLGQVRPYHAAIVEPQLQQFCGGQYRMHEMTAAVALAQLRKLDAIRAHCKGLHDRLMQHLQPLQGLRFRPMPDPEGQSGFELYFYLPEARLVPEFTTRLRALNVHCSKGTGTYCHYSREFGRLGLAHTPAASPFKHLAPMPAPGYREQDFPRTEDIISRYMALPLGVLFTTEDVDYIGACVTRVHAEVMG